MKYTLRPANPFSVAFFLFIMLILTAEISFAQDGKAFIRLGQITLHPAPNAQQWIDSAAQAGAGSTPVQILMQFATLPTASQRSLLQEHGILLQDYLPEKSFTALLAKRLNSFDVSVTGLQSITVLQPSWKLIGGIKAGTGNQPVALLVSFIPQVSKSDVLAQLQSLSGSILPSNLETFHCYKISLPQNKITALAAWYAVKSIGPAGEDQALNLQSRQATQVNIAQNPVSDGGYGLLGDSMTIGVGDNTSGVSHIDLRDRITNFNPAPYTNHGQHINGIVGGAGIIDPRGGGFAPHAHILDHLYNLVWARTGTMFRDYKMSVTNNSYASVVGDCSFEGTYDANAQALDSVTLQYDTVLHVFAAGNDGNMTCAPYPQGYHTVTGGYQPAKNVLVVAQVDKRFVEGNGSSVGPVRDGRLKPEITAIGTSVLSTSYNDTYLISGGTSMASPQVAGGALLLQERYKQTHSNHFPRADLIKTLLMNGATDLFNPGPDFQTGFGLMDEYRSLQMMDSNRYIINTIANAGQQSIIISVPANMAQLKVMLYWHDAPASTLAAKALVNDLDLQVTEPNNMVHKPLILDTSAAGVTNNAVEGADHLNNVEQVTINTPAAGSYTVNVAGYSVPSGNQPYVVAYDYVPANISLTWPATGEAVNAIDTVRLYWTTPVSTTPFTAEYSLDNGATWSTIANNIPANQRYYSWFPGTGISSGQARTRVSRNAGADVSTSGPFVLTPLTPLQLSTVQCPGYINIHWSPVLNATGYQVYRKKGYYLQPEAVTTDTNYTFSGLSVDSVYYVTIAPIVNGGRGYRSFAVKRQPNDGSCAGNFSNGDLSVERILSPNSGRQLTSSQLGTNETLSVSIRNNDDVPATSYTLSYRINGGAWQSQNVSTAIPAASAQTINISGLNLSAAGSYNIQVAVTNLAIADPVHANDSMSKGIRQLTNTAVNLATGFAEDFEAMPVISLQKDSLGITSNDHWDYHNNNDTARLRSFVTDDITISGNRSISLDLVQTWRALSNFLTGTFNTAAYNTSSSEVRAQFDYKFHGTPQRADSNALWVRGADTQPWTLLYKYDTTAAPGQVIHSGSLSVTDALQSASQNFSSSMQIRFGQRDTSVIALNDYGNGVTIDNVKLYTVQNDVQLLSILSPVPVACSLSNATPVTIRVYNSVNNTQTNVQLYYRLDGGAVVNETLSSIAAKTAVNYTFTHTLNASTPGVHTLSVWIVASGDTYAANDSIINFRFRNEPLISSYPYLENFEGGDGYWYAGGLNSSWQYGTPNTPNVHNAASGTKAWKTNLSGNYNDNELSYLYSPCFDISQLSNPMLSFSAIVNVENCGGVLCDQAWMEYSTDGGATWAKLGAYGQGYYWYDDSARNVWRTQGSNRWHVASIPLPASVQLMRFRYVLASDPGTDYEGLAIDDIHIFSRTYPVYNGGTTGPATQSVSGSGYTDFVQSGGLVAEINPAGQTLGSTDITLYQHINIIDTQASQYYFPRSFVVHTAQAPSDSVTARLFVLDSDVVRLVNATGCTVCSKPADIYRLGMTKYDDPVPADEDSSLGNNVSGIYTFYNHNKVAWVPYDRGYYAEVKVPSFSELYFNDGGLGGGFPLPVAAVDFNAEKISSTQVKLSWLSHIDTQVTQYDLQRSPDGSAFSTIYSVHAMHKPSATYAYVDTPSVNTGSSVYYQLRWTMLDGSKYVSPVKRIDWTGANTINAVFPKPTQDGVLNVRWSGNPGAVLSVMLTDIAGKIVYRNAFTGTAWNNTTTFTTGNAANGIYFLRCEVGGNVLMQKVVFGR